MERSVRSVPVERINQTVGRRPALTVRSTTLPGILDLRELMIVNVCCVFSPICKLQSELFSRHLSLQK